MRHRPKTTKKRSSERGLASAEFALTITFVIFVLFWAFELMMFVYSYSVLADAAKEGVRYAVVHGCGTDAATCSGTCSPTACTDSAGDNVKAQVTNFAQLTFHDMSAITVNVTYPDGSAKSSKTVRVVVQYAYRPYFSLGWTPPTLNAAAEGRIAN